MNAQQKSKENLEIIFHQRLCLSGEKDCQASTPLWGFLYKEVGEVKRISHKLANWDGRMVFKNEYLIKVAWNPKIKPDIARVFLKHQIYSIISANREGVGNGSLILRVRNYE